MDRGIVSVVSVYQNITISAYLLYNCGGSRSYGVDTQKINHDAIRLSVPAVRKRLMYSTTTARNSRFVGL